MKAIFLRALEETDDKSRVVREAIISPNIAFGKTRFEVEAETFKKVPRSPFAYWVSDYMRGRFAELPAFESDGRTAKQGLATADDFRFVRFWTEVGAGQIARRWFPLAKGGKFSPFYADVHLVVDWLQGGSLLESYRGSVIRNPDYFFRPGLTWPARPHRRGVFALVPRGCVFSHTGTMVFEPKETSIIPSCALLNSDAYIGLLHLLMPRGTGASGQTLKYEVGYVTSVPVPSFVNEASIAFTEAGRRIWKGYRGLESGLETSHAFLLPSILQITGDSLADRVANWLTHVSRMEEEIATYQAEINESCFKLYGIDGSDRKQIEKGLNNNVEDADFEGGEDGELDIHGLDKLQLVRSLISWCIGVSFGRFDLRQATGERPTPPEPDPFDPLPICAPGMLTGEDGLPVDDSPSGYPIDFPLDGILVDDPGASGDLVATARKVFEFVFVEPSSRWEEAADILGDRGQSLRGWFAREFFELHIKRYSKSRRKAPIYWQLATPSASFSTWLYYHRVSRNTLFHLLNNHVTPKLQHEERKLSSLTQEAGPDPSVRQRKEIAGQENAVGELRAFRDEVARVAPLWNPDLNDGVILNFAPLWRLVPQHKTWQKECKKTWGKLCKGDFDWSHLSMHLWPERVVPKCAKDRSLAIAHGLEDVFWQEDAEGKWHSRKVDRETVEQLIAERTVPAVKSALDDLISAPAPTGGRRRRTRS